MARKSKTQINDEVHSEALSRFERLSSEKDQRELAVEDMFFTFVEGYQWEDGVARRYIEADRPRYEINRCEPVVRQNLGEFAKTDISIKYRPASGDSSKDIANTLNGLTRNIDATSHSKTAYQNAYKEALAGGYGAWRVNTRVSDDTLFGDLDSLDSGAWNQDICIEPVYDAASTVYFDPGAKLQDKSDAQWAFLAKWVSKEGFKAKWPNASASDFPENKSQFGRCESWYSGEKIRVAEYWVRTKETRKIALLSDGRVIDLAEKKDVLDELALQGVEVVKQRTVKRDKVQQWVISGAEVLEGPTDWAGKYIPLVPIYGDRTVIEGKEYIHGIIRFAKDAQRINNYAISAIVEKTATSSLDKIAMTGEQIKGRTDDLSRVNSDNKPILVYNKDEGSTPPYRIGPSPIEGALVNITQQSTNDVIQTLGAAAGVTVPEQSSSLDTRSGKAVIEQKRTGESGTFSYLDSFLTGVVHTGRILADLIPKIYDTERQVRIISPDGSEDFVTINQTVKDKQTGKNVVINDLSQGKYDIAVDVGPAYATQRMEAADRMLGLLEKDPAITEAARDIIIQNIDVPGSDELHKRVRAMQIKQGIIQPTDEEVKEMGLDQPQEPTPAEQLQMMEAESRVRLFAAEADKAEADALKTTGEAAKLQADAALVMAKVENTRADTLKKTTEAQGNFLENTENAAEMGFAYTEQDHDTQVGMNDAVESAQQSINPGLTSEQAEIIGES